MQTYLLLFSSKKMNPAKSIPIYKIVVIGDDNIGKTRWIKSLDAWSTTTEHPRVRGLSVSPLVLDTTFGKVVIELVEVSGNVEFEMHRDIHQRTSAVLIFFNSKTETVSSRLQTVRATLGNVPIVKVNTQPESKNDTVIADVHISPQDGEYSPLELVLQRFLRVREKVSIISERTNLHMEYEEYEEEPEEI